MKTVGRRVLVDRTFQEGHLRVVGDDLEVVLGEPGEAPGLVCPPFVDAHTHLGDAALAPLDLDGTIEEVFAPPDGLKHRHLAKLSDDDAVAGMVRALETMAATGTTRFYDFREDGLDGVDLLEAALAEGDVDGRILGRPADLAFDADEVDALLDRCHGLGLSAVRDFPDGEAEAIAAHVHDHDGVLALHASEATREPIEPILAVEPDQLVHLCQATDDDLQRVVDEDVAVTCCPRSNDRFDLEPPIPELVELGADLSLGTDNAMFQAPDMVAEVRHALAMFPELPPATGLDLATRDPFEGDRGLVEGPAEAAVVLDHAGSDPGEALRDGRVEVAATYL